MATLPMRAPVLPPLASFARVFSYFNVLIEAFADAQEQAAQVHKRFPFAEW